MRAVDTNVLVRLLVREDARQLRAAEEFVCGGAWVPLLVLAETIWVLSSVYERSPHQIAGVIEILLRHNELILQDPELVVSALNQFMNNPAVGFTDCLILASARKAGHLPLGTFDKALGKLDDVQRL